MEDDGPAARTIRVLSAVPVGGYRKVRGEEPTREKRSLREELPSSPAARMLRNRVTMLPIRMPVPLERTTHLTTLKRIDGCSTLNFIISWAILPAFQSL